MNIKTKVVATKDRSGMLTDEYLRHYQPPSSSSAQHRLPVRCGGMKSNPTNHTNLREKNEILKIFQ